MLERLERVCDRPFSDHRVRERSYKGPSILIGRLFSDLPTSKLDKFKIKSISKKSEKADVRTNKFLTTLKPKQSNLFNYTKSYHAYGR
jgi:hypothetical protein